MIDTGECPICKSRAVFFNRDSLKQLMANHDVEIIEFEPSPAKFTPFAIIYALVKLR